MTRQTRRLPKPLPWTVVGLVFSLASLASAGMVTDQLGREMTIPDNPQRIVSLAPNITEIIYAIGQGHRLVGATRFSDYPPEAARLPKVGSYVYLDLERIVGLKPDLCIAIKDGNPKAVIDRLEALGIPIYAVDPRDLMAVIETTLEMGRLLGAAETARQLASDLRTRVQTVADRVAEATHRPGVFFQIGISPIVSVGTDTFIHGLIERAGGRNLAVGPKPYPQFSREQIITLAPEVLIISSMVRDDAFQRAKAEWDPWREVPAVRNQRIFLVDSDQFNRPTPRLVDALETLASLIHPELFEEEH